jgi:hypothetical protein
MTEEYSPQSAQRKRAASVDNPWLHIPAEPPYVLPEDAEAVARFNRTASPNHFLRVDKILPEAFMGVKDAPVVLLSNNPGFSSLEEREKFRQQPMILEWMRKNLHHEPLDYPFYYLNPVFNESDWWVVRLRPLIERFKTPTQNGRQLIAKSVLNVVYFPYPSLNFGHRQLRLASQNYGFQLVREAVNRKAVIVLLRRGKENQKVWLEAVPELNGYDQFYLGSNPQAPYVSPGNCPSFFETVVQAVAAFTERQTATM